MADILRQRVADLIRDSGLSQTQLAKSTGVAQSVISEICSGGRPNIRAETLAKLGQGLGLSATRLGQLLYESVE